MKTSDCKKRATALAIFGATMLAGTAQGVERESLAGIWQCRFLQAKTFFEETYYSQWNFDPSKNQLVIFWSPVHKGEQFRYRWDGNQLMLDEPWGPPSPHYGTFSARMRDGTELVVEMPNLRWKGWLCQPRPNFQWSKDGLQFLDYSRYPWLSKLVEDSRSILRYQDPGEAEKWLKEHPN